MCYKFQHERTRGKVHYFLCSVGSRKNIHRKTFTEQPKRPLHFLFQRAIEKKREGETDGKDYYFLSTEKFKEYIEQEKFIEWEEVYQDNYYGTLKSEIERIWKDGKHVIFDIDVKGGLSLSRYFKEKALAIFVMSPL